MILNATRETVLAQRPLMARRPWTRMRGMIGRRFNDFDAMVFPRCGEIHMWFMQMPLDVLFLDGDDCVIKEVIHLQPWRMAMARGAKTVIELPAGAVGETHTRTGDRIEWREC